MIVSILSAGWVTDVLGRRATLVLSNLFLMTGRRARHVARRQLRGAHGFAVRRQRRRWVLDRRLVGVQSRD